MAFEGEEGGIDLGAIRKEREELQVQRTLSPGTIQAYAAGWRKFCKWCHKAKLDPLPASPETVILYAIDMGHAHKWAYIDLHMNAIRWRHAEENFPSPITPEVREDLANLRRKIGAAQNAKQALSPDDLRKVLSTAGKGVYGVRNRCVLLLGFASACRRSELSALQLSDVTTTAEGVVLLIRKSKTDQLSFGQEIGIHRGENPSTCPINALAAWLKERGDWPGPLFCYVKRETNAIKRRRLHPQVVSQILKAAAAAAGLDATKLAAHSLRAGCATAAAAAGAKELAIMGRTRHKSMAMLKRYVRHGSLFAVDPLRGVL